MKTPLLILISCCFYLNAHSQEGWHSIDFKEMDKTVYYYNSYRPEVKPTSKEYFICSSKVVDLNHKYDNGNGNPYNGMICGPFVEWKFIKYYSASNKLWIAGWTYNLKYVISYPDSLQKSPNVTPCAVPYRDDKKIFFTESIYSYKPIYYDGYIESPCPVSGFHYKWNSPPPIVRPESKIDSLSIGYPYFTNRTPFGTIDSTNGYFDVQFYPTKDLHLAIGKMFSDLRKIPFKDLKPKGVVLDLDSTLYNDSLKGWVLPDTLSSMQLYKWTHKFSNTGDGTINFEITATHGCMVGSLPKKPILPGKSGEIRYMCQCEVGYPHYRGYNVTILYNGKAMSVIYFFFTNNLERKKRKS